MSAPSAPVSAKVGCPHCNTTPPSPAGSPIPTPASTRTNAGGSQGGVDSLDERSIAGALPAWDDVIHHVPEGHACVRIGEAQRTTGAEVTEAARVRSEWPIGSRWLKAEAERDLLAEHRAVPNRLRTRRFCQ